MPIHSYICTRCSHETEELFRSSEIIPKEYLCEKCNAIAIHKFPIFAKTEFRWGSGHSYYDRALGREIRNSMHKEQVMEEMGVVHLNDAQIQEQTYQLEADLVKSRQHEKTFGTEDSVDRLTQTINSI